MRVIEGVCNCFITAVYNASKCTADERGADKLWMRRTVVVSISRKTGKDVKVYKVGKGDLGES